MYSLFFRSWLSRRRCIARRFKNVRRADGLAVGSTTLYIYTVRRKQAAIESILSTSATFDSWLQTGQNGSQCLSRPWRYDTASLSARETRGHPPFGWG